MCVRVCMCARARARMLEPPETRKIRQASNSREMAFDRSTEIRKQLTRK